MSDQIHSYTELRKHIRAALRRQHPEWLDANGKSPLCDFYEARFTESLAILTKKVDSRTDSPLKKLSTLK